MVHEYAYFVMNIFGKRSSQMTQVKRLKSKLKMLAFNLAKN